MGGPGRGYTGTNRCGYGGGGSRGLVVATRVARAEMGGAPPPSDKGVKMFELAELNVFIPKVRRGGATHWWFIARC